MFSSPGYPVNLQNTDQYKWYSIGCEVLGSLGVKCCGCCGKEAVFEVCSSVIMQYGERAVRGATNGNISERWPINRRNDNSGGVKSLQVRSSEEEGETNKAALHHYCF